MYQRPEDELMSAVEKYGYEKTVAALWHFCADNTAKLIKEDPGTAVYWNDRGAALYKLMREIV